MSAYRELKVTIKPKSAFLTPLVADTLWGHLIWAEIYSGGSIDEWVNVENEHPPLIISDVFPEGWLPAPVMAVQMSPLRDRIRREADGDEQFARFSGIAKRATKMPELPEEVVARLLASDDMSTEMIEVIAETFDASRCPRCLVQVECDPDNCPALTGSDSIDERRACEEKLKNIEPQREFLPSRHTAVDRVTGTAAEGLLFDLSDQWLGGKWTCWMRTTLDADHIKRLMDYVGESGYGKRASVGRGRFDVGPVKDGRPLADLAPKRGKHMILSSSLIPHEGFSLGDADRYRIRVKRGKRHDNSQYIKKPVAMFEAGSIFRGTPETYVGRLVSTTYEEDDPVVEYGIAYPVAF